MNDLGFSLPAAVMPPPVSSMNSYQRPSFSEDGASLPGYNSLLNAVSSSTLNQDISYDTSSKDPLMVRARVFIGNIIRGPITRDDLIELFKPFGKLLALTFFKQGYAFVQFSEAHEADAACTGLNGKRWKGAIIDVHLAMTGPVGKKKYDSVEGSFSDFSRKRRYDDFSREENVLDETAEQNKRNRDIALRDMTCNEDLSDSVMADTLICGSCRFVTCDFESYKDHRIAGCKSLKVDGEPKVLRCASCSQRFLSAWALICHLTDFHRMMLCRVEKSEEKNDDESGTPPTKRAGRAPSPSSTNGPFSTHDSSGTTPALNTSDLSIGENRAPSAASYIPIGTSAAQSVAPPQEWNPLTGQTILGGSSIKIEQSDNFSAIYGMR
ncbi:unnamed protein product [Auanema sp. JU1783]|nr:unnamed protein product [Auanema sp. JU1783]